MSELTTVVMHMHRETKKAIHVSENGDEARAVWLPASQIEDMTEVQKGSNVWEITLPMWLAKKNGLL